MKILLIGGTGQLGLDIIKNSPKNIKLLAPNRTQLDLSKSEDCYKYIVDLKPDWVINSGAYTNVEKAEKEKELALKINAKGPESIAKALSETGGKLLQISTDYVFDGKKNTPYKVNDNISPINFYGLSKAKGEEYIQRALPRENQLCIIRTSWLMSPFGKNFANKIMELISDRDELKVIYDQIACPTTTRSLSKIVWKAIEYNNIYTLKQDKFPKINHFSNSGIASWYDVAVELKEIGLKYGFLKKSGDIIPVLSKEYKTDAMRPNYSVLDTSDLRRILNISNKHWRKSLSEAFQEIKIST